MKRILIGLFFSLISSLSFSQKVDYLPLNSEEMFFHVESEKDGKTNAAIICVKQNNICIYNNEKMSLMQFVRKAGYLGVHDISTKTFSGVEHFVLFVWK